MRIERDDSYDSCSPCSRELSARARSPRSHPRAPAAPRRPPASRKPERRKAEGAPDGARHVVRPRFLRQADRLRTDAHPAVVGVANRTLPCGTLVKVSYHGSHVLTVPVLDRGPYSSIGADWDLTGAAAEALGITETVRIHVRVVGSTPNVPTLGLAPGSATSTSALAGGAQAG